MYAVTIAAPGGPEVLTWSEVDDPVPGPEEIVIDVAAAGVNRADLLQRAGYYPPPPGAPPYPGLECSGVVAAVGPEVHQWQRGEQVCALLPGGGYAQRVAVHQSHVLPVPQGVSLVDAAALPEAACTVWSNVFQLGTLQPLDTLLVHGGGSGIGTFAIQLANVHGCPCRHNRPGGEARRATGAGRATSRSTMRAKTLSSLSAPPPVARAPT